MLITFIAIDQIKGDPVSSMHGPHIPSEKQREIKKEELGFNETLTTQIIEVFTKCDFGKSFYREQTRASLLFWGAFKQTFILVFLSIVLGSFVGILLGSLSSFWQNSKKSLFLDFLSIVIISSPTFIMGFLLQLVFTSHFHCLPTSGFDKPSQMILPVLTLSLMISGNIFQTTQTNMNQILKQPYIKTAHTKGVSKKNIIFKHALKNALIPIWSHIGFIFSFLLGGSIITEYIFNVQGVGRLIIGAFGERDLAVIRTSIILLALFIIIFNIFLEFIYLWLDPKLRKKNRLMSRKEMIKR